ncbi:FkbM family methyltransferase [Glaciecola sp. KUL10]|uniref:FkbM family methyltransferase n=1 Tax=Glaciecola sp. (strain KUL10) TaxID=2161813 RepID=UPI000D7874B0|nr:FkbM family methyltransferase [Glaciecola sp. KUL10]GBL05459.1 methyltransferase FkbM family [Glaciecola sp. KUL10]
MSIKTKLGWLLSNILYQWNPIKARRKKRFYAELLNPNDLCFDVGAHLGDRCQTWLSLGARVVAVEPQPAFAEYLERKYQFQTGFSLETYALGAKKGNAKLAISHLFPTLSTLSGSEWEAELNRASSLPIYFDEQVTVEVSTLDLMIERHGQPKFCKIDVEGYEHEVLLGLTTPIQYLSFEFLSCSLKRAQDCLTRLESLGYQKFKWSYKEDFKFANEKWLSAQNVIEHIKQHPNKLFSGDIYCQFKH